MIDPETGIWDMDTVNRGGHKHDEALVQAIAGLYNPQQAADLGCGDGWYCKRLRELGWPSVHGYEGCEEMKKEGVYDDIFTLDLTKRRWIGIPYGFILCLEVGEHIPPEHEQVFLDNVAEFGRYASAVVLSWAVPGQGGRGHFNERDNSYVSKNMMERGFIVDPWATRYLREHSSLKWFKNTVVAYGREGNF